MKVHFYCGCNVWEERMSVLFDEPRECSAEGDIEVDDDDWEYGSVTCTCPSCGMMLEQGNGHFEEAPRET